MHDTLTLLEALIARRSVTPDDAGCQALVIEQLAPLGFQCEVMVHGPAERPVTNLWATHRGSRSGPTVALAGHTDVVPSGSPQAWASDPFVPHHRGGRLFGRGAADMKASIAAMTVAAASFVRARPDHSGTVGLLFTSDEEGPSVDGTVRVVEALTSRHEALHYCIVGEPTSVQQLGDTLKNGRRGSLSGRLVVRGIQGHVAYPHLARNPVHQMAPALAELAATTWDHGNEHFPPTTWQISNVHAGTGALNVVPGEAVVDFNFRFSTESTPESLRQRVESVLHRHGLEFKIDWNVGAAPFLTRPGRLSEVLIEAIRAETGVQAALSTTGGTSDGRFLAQVCDQVIEFGPINATIHQVDECVEVADLKPLTAIYRRALEALLP